MGRYKYNSVYGLNPPTFHEVKELDESKFGSSSLNNANTAIIDNAWQLVTHSDNRSVTNTGNPLNGLNRMGMLDLLDHKEEEQVTLVDQSDDSSLGDPFWA